MRLCFVSNAERGQKWSEMVRNGQKWSNMILNVRAPTVNEKVPIVYTKMDDAENKIANTKTIYQTFGHIGR